jgi:hypothetical protein
MRSRDERKAEFDRREAIRKERYQAAKDAHAAKWAELNERDQASRDARAAKRAETDERNRPAKEARIAKRAEAEDRSRAAREARLPAPLILPADGERLDDEQLAALRPVAARLNAPSEGIAGIFNQPTIQESRDAFRARVLIAEEMRLRAAEALE